MPAVYYSFVVGNAALVHGPPSIEMAKYKGDRREVLKFILDKRVSLARRRCLRVQKFEFEFQKGSAYNITQSWGLSTGYA